MDPFEILASFLALADKYVNILSDILHVSLA